jgi:hypothetical protein
MPDKTLREVLCKSMGLHYACQGNWLCCAHPNGCEIVKVTEKEIGEMVIGAINKTAVTDLHGCGRYYEDEKLMNNLAQQGFKKGDTDDKEK